MDVDATRTREEFMQRMRGKCFGCGSAGHTKKDGNHEHDLCSYCKRMGHRVMVCMDKFLGRPQSQKAAATEEEESIFDGISDIMLQDGSSEGSEIAGIAAASGLPLTRVPVVVPSATLSQVLEQQKVLMGQIAALSKKDF
jgi:hypothetical protein